MLRMKDFFCLTTIQKQMPYSTTTISPPENQALVHTRCACVFAHVLARVCACVVTLCSCLDPGLLLPALCHGLQMHVMGELCFGGGMSSALLCWSLQFRLPLCAAY